MTKPAFATGTNSWRTCESPRRAECDRIRKEKEQEENAIILPDDDKDGKYQYHPKPNPNVVFKWPTKSGRTKADCERICRNAIRNSAPGKICSKVTELSFAPYIALCVVDLKVMLITFKLCFSYMKYYNTVCIILGGGSLLD